MTDKGFRVTVEDLETGTSETRLVPLHEFFYLTTGDCHVSSVARYGNGTMQFTVKGCTAKAPPDAVGEQREGSPP